MSRYRFRNAEAARDVGEQAHRHELGGSDAESAECERDDGKPAHDGVGCHHRDGAR